MKPAAPAASSEDNTPAVDTRTAQQKEIDEAIANGTWGIEYTTCQKCGYHNWTRQGNVYVCDTCGNTTTTVVGPKGVKGYVGSGAIAAVAPKASAPETRYATAAEAQAAADKREAAYAAAVAAFQKQIDAQNAAYLAAFGKYPNREGAHREGAPLFSLNSPPKFAIIQKSVAAHGRKGRIL